MGRWGDRVEEVRGTRRGPGLATEALGLWGISAAPTLVCSWVVGLGACRLGAGSVSEPWPPHPTRPGLPRPRAPGGAEAGRPGSSCWK